MINSPTTQNNFNTTQSTKAVSPEIIKEIVSEIETPAEPSRIDKIYFDYVANRTPALRNEIIKKNQALVTFIVGKFYNVKKSHKLLREDLLQEGTIGLMSAIEGYKPELGYKFSTYATWWIKQAVNNYLLNVEPIIHVPSHVRTANNKLARKLREENILYQDFIEGYKDADYSDKMIRSINCAIRTKNMVSLDEPIKSTGEGQMSLKDVLADSTDNGVESLFDSVHMIEIVKKSLAKLSDKERYILLLRFDVIDSVPVKKEK